MLTSAQALTEELPSASTGSLVLIWLLPPLVLGAALARLSSASSLSARGSVRSDALRVPNAGAQLIGLVETEGAGGGVHGAGGSSIPWPVARLRKR